MTYIDTESKLVKLIRKTNVAMQNIAYTIGNQDEENVALSELIGEFEIILARHNVDEQIKSASVIAVEAARLCLEANQIEQEDDRVAVANDGRSLGQVAERMIGRYAKTLD